MSRSSFVVDLDRTTLRRIIRGTAPDSVVGVYARLALALEEGRGLRLSAAQVAEVVLGDTGVQQALWTYLEEEEP